MPYGDFFKGVNPWFWSTIRIFPLLAFKEKTAGNSISWPSGYKTSLATLKKKGFSQITLWRFFSKGLTHDSGQELEFFLCLLLNKKRLEIMFPDHPVRKQVYLDWKIKIFPSRPMEVFLGKTSFKFSAPKIWETVPPGLKCLPYHKFKKEWKSCHLTNQIWP